MKTVKARITRRASIDVCGLVQGVGFRPFVYRLAVLYNLRGWVRNTSGNVEIEVEGEGTNIDGFLNDLQNCAPPMSYIDKMDISWSPPNGYRRFKIQESRSENGKYQLISPDIATCKDCLDEILDPSNRRFRYPFTNCTNCGPRFTIIEDIPYDRPKTTMRIFQMCPECEKEYHDPQNRRFHAQPNACPVCGPQLELVDSQNKHVECADVVNKAGELLKAGKILALKGLGGFQLACDATNQTAVALLRDRKHRTAKPFAVMMSTIGEIRKHCQVSDEEEQLLKSPASPIVLIRWYRDNSNIADGVAPGLKNLGIILPYTPLHHLLLQEVGLPLVMTSGNLSEEPIAKDNDEAFTRLKGIADYFLLHNRGIYARYDDSVYIVESREPLAVRRSRGYAPYPIQLSFQSRQILACGSELKNTFCLTRDNHAFISQHIGDMENEETLKHYENTIELYKKLFRIEPEIITCDIHPEYLPSKYALNLANDKRLKLVPVQHHHAHIVSCLVDNNIQGPTIGVAFDGVGYGTDGAFWGGEFLVADCHGFRRAGHLEYVPMPGGAAAIKKPYRMALGYLMALLGNDFSLEGLPLANLDRREISIIKKQIATRFNCPHTSSAGRVFDAVAALTGVRQEISYEGQAAIELEMLASDESAEKEIKPYPFTISEQSGVKLVKLGELFKDVVQDVRYNKPVAQISLKFHYTMAAIALEMCRLISHDTGLKQVALSGGVFQNRLLLRLTVRQLEQAEFKVLTHHLVPCNDGGISLGQAVIANFNRE